MPPISADKCRLQWRGNNCKRNNFRWGWVGAEWSPDGAVIADPVRRVWLRRVTRTPDPIGNTSACSPVELDTATGWTLFSRLNDASGSFRPLRVCPGHDSRFPAHLCFAGSHRDLSQPPHAHIPAVPESSNAHAVEVLPVTSPARGWLPLVMPLQPTGFLPVHSWLLLCVSTALPLDFPTDATGWTLRRGTPSPNNAHAVEHS